MVVEKNFLGSVNIGKQKVHYYLLKKDSIYGVELDEETGNGMLCEMEYFTESYEEAYQIGMLMKQGQVTLTTMVNVLDDYIQ